MICDVTKQDYIELIELWEKSVRATHDFLSDEEIGRLKKRILDKYFDAVLLKCFKNRQGSLLGFCGILDHKIEMLFVAPSAQGQGVGTALCHYAIKYHAALKVTVNEQNPRAILFYEKMGFTIVGRSELDGEGKRYPILYMEK